MKPHDLAELLLAKARADLQAAKVLAQAPDVADEAVGFHAQQAVEKALKASLTVAGVRVGRTHELGRLYSETTIDEPLDRAATVGLTESAVDWAAEQVRGAH
jgi:HEPN domain-containing protein